MPWRKTHAGEGPPPGRSGETTRAEKRKSSSAAARAAVVSVSEEAAVALPFWFHIAAAAAALSKRRRDRLLRRRKLSRIGRSWSVGGPDGFSPGGALATTTGLKTALERGTDMSDERIGNGPRRVQPENGAAMSTLDTEWIAAACSGERRDADTKPRRKRGSSPASNCERVC